MLSLTATRNITNTHLAIIWWTSQTIKYSGCRLPLTTSFSKPGAIIMHPYTEKKTLCLSSLHRQNYPIIWLFESAKKFSESGKSYYTLCYNMRFLICLISQKRSGPAKELFFAPNQRNMYTMVWKVCSMTSLKMLPVSHSGFGLCFYTSPICLSWLLTHLYKKLTK